MANTALDIPVKYCKSLLASSSTAFSQTNALRFFDKALYEFWGFCINGQDDLTVPGGFAAVNYPANFQSGTTLIAAGRDGSTEFGTDIFESLGSNFQALNSGSLIGKYLVLWRPGENSTDDSIYMIKSVEDPFHIRVDVHSGGTRRLGNHPWFWDRNAINWRIVDIDKTVNMSGWGSGHYMVLNMEAAPNVNPGQAISQVKLMHLTGAAAGVECVTSLVFSPSGSWDPVSGTFTDGTAEQKITMFVDSNASAFRGQALYSFTAGGDFLIAHVRACSDSTTAFGGVQAGFTSGSGFHVEIPKRLYPADIDPNPIAWLTWSNAQPSQIASTYFNNVKMKSFDDSVRSYTTLVRSPHGSHVRSDYTSAAYGLGQWQQFKTPNYRFSKFGYNVEDNQIITSDGVLSLPATGHFSTARVRLRRVRFTSANIARGGRMGDPITEPYGWVYLENGVLWPWDNSILPQRPWRFGV